MSRLTNDTTLVQTVVGSSLSMGLRNLVMGLGAIVMLVWTNPVLMLQVLAVLVLVVRVLVCAALALPLALVTCVAALALTFGTTVADTLLDSRVLTLPIALALALSVTRSV